MTNAEMSRGLWIFARRTSWSMLLEVILEQEDYWRRWASLRENLDEAWEHRIDPLANPMELNQLISG